MQRDLQRPIPAELVTNPIGVPVAPAPMPTKTVVTPKFVLNVLRRWWKLASMIGVVLAVVAGFLSFYTYKPTFEAITWMEFRQDWVIDRPDDDGRFVVTQRELIRSPPILAEALAKPEISSLPIFNGIVDPITWLRGKIVATPIAGSNLFTISLRDEHKESVARVVNAVREAYLANLNTDTARRNDSLLGTLESERNRRQVTIDQETGRLRSLVREAAENGAQIPLDIGFGEKQNRGIAPINPADFLKQEIADSEVDIIMSEAALKVLAESLSPEGDIQIDPDTLEDALSNEPEIVKLNEELMKSEDSLADNAARLKGESSFLKKRQDEIKTVTDKIASAKKRLKPKVSQELLTLERKNRRTKINEFKGTIEREKMMKAVLEERLVQAKKDAKDVGVANLDITIIRDNIEREKRVLDKIVDRIDQIKTESRTSNRIYTHQEATEPKEPTGTGPIPQSLMFAMVAFCLPFGAVFLWELRSRRVADAEDFSDVTNLRVVGEISTLPIRSRFLPSSNKRFEESLSRFEESIDYLRTAILIARHQRTVQSLVVCSAASREGKSTVAAHLASSLARGISGKVLLVDADMRRPHLHRLLDQDPEHGLVDYLAGRCEFDDVLRTTWVERLDFVAAGVLDTPVGILLANDRFERFLRQAERTYEFIVIDVPPILPVSEGLIIAKCADGAIFCGLRDVSTVLNISRACDKLRAAGVNIFGAVFNGVPPREYGASGYYYYRIPSQPAITDGSPAEEEVEAE